MKAFLLLVSFFTRIPMSGVEYSDELYSRGVKLFPLVGIIIGLFTALPFFLFPMASRGIRAILVVVCYLAISGGIHLDGLADSMDGLLSGRPKGRMLEIMKDSRIGSFGVIGLIIYFMIFYQTASEVGSLVIVFMPFIGKSCAVYVAGLSEYARPESGMGTVFLNEHRPINSYFIFLINIAIAVFLFGISGAVWAFITFLFAHMLMRWICIKIDGMTGDTIGLVVESTQMLFLIIASLV